MGKNQPGVSESARPGPIAEKELLSLQDQLAQRRQEILHQVGDLESRWQEGSERQIEVEETAQDLELSDPYPPVDDLERGEVAEIDRALGKIAAGSFGFCETCGQPIPLKRLKSIPWTKYCLRDAEKEERRKFIENV